MTFFKKVNSVCVRESLFLSTRNGAWLGLRCKNAVFDVTNRMFVLRGYRKMFPYVLAFNIVIAPPAGVHYYHC